MISAGGDGGSLGDSWDLSGAKRREDEGGGEYGKVMEGRGRDREMWR